MPFARLRVERGAIDRLPSTASLGRVPGVQLVLVRSGFFTRVFCTTSLGSCPPLVRWITVMSVRLIA